MRQRRFAVTFNRDFASVIDECAALKNGRQDTWINRDIRQLYVALHRLGFAHSVEVWQEDRLVGGLYGVALRSAFFGESMFSRRTDASKIALVHLVARLRAGGFRLLDAQFTNDHLQQFGIFEVTREQFQQRLQLALATSADLLVGESSDGHVARMLDEGAG